ncbi:MAG: sugar phosphate isomerase/epimerase [Candidatus Sumerlaeota bacterium]|nr:sugar phosphate isomerase/epimerase [Candidatus Sumerlaeota bacterium]
MWKTCLGENGFIAKRLYGYDISVDQVLDHAEEMNYDGVELHPGFDPFPKADDSAAIVAFLKKFAARGLRVAGIQAPIHGLRAFAPDREERMAFAKAACALIDLGCRLGAEQIGFWPAGRQKDLSDDQIVERLAETFQPIAEHAGRRGVMTTIEPEPVQIDYTYEIASRIVKTVGSPNFKFLFDCAHAEVLTANALEAARRFAGQYGHVHFCDSNGKTLDLEGCSRTSAHLAAGDGRLDLPAILRAFKETGYDRWLQVDMWENPDPFRCSRLTKRVVDKA